MGKNDIEDALKKLDKLTQEEARMATAEVLKITHGVDDKAKVLVDGMQMTDLILPGRPFSNSLNCSASGILQQTADETKGIVQRIEKQTASNEDIIKRMSFPSQSPL
jgi:adenylosuccinate synthase